MWKIATSLAAIGLSFCVATAAEAFKGGGGGGGGGAAHFSGGGGMAHFSGGGGVAHFSAPRFSGGGVARFASPRISHLGSLRTSHLSGLRTSHLSGLRAHHLAHVTTHPLSTVTGNHPNANGPLHTANAGLTKHTDPKNFGTHREFAANTAFHSFMRGAWHRNHHLGWVGPLFWPYAFGDFFYCGLWPYDYCYYDPFWEYGYADIYEGIFSPYDYNEYVQGPSAPARMTALTQSVAQSCTQEAAEVTGWPIDQIQTAVEPSEQQSALLDALGNAIVKAGDVIKSHCPTTVSFTPTGRIAEMQERLEGLVAAVNIVEPPLTKFYDALSDEQKARFNGIGAPGGSGAAQRTSQTPQSQCGENVMAWPADRIDHVVQPTDAQRPKLEALQTAAGEAADAIKAACPSELPGTPPARLAAEAKRLQAMLQAVKTIRPPLDDFYSSLSDDQKARFNTMGRELFAAR